MSITLVSYIWANRLATSENLMVHWCKHYSAMSIDMFRICLNVNGEIDDSGFFSKIITDNLCGRNVEITIDKSKFCNSRKIRYMNNFVKNGSDVDLYIPVDCDEFIEYDIENEKSKLLASPYQAIRGRLVDMVSIKNSKIELKKVSLNESILDQFPIEHNIYLVSSREVCIK